MDANKMEKLNIHLHRIPLPFRLNHVNTWLVKEEHGYTVIDTGLNHPDAEAAWAKVLAEHPIRRIIITHYHPDHYGYAGRLQALTGAEVWMSKRDQEMAREIWSHKHLTFFEQHYLACGLSKELARRLSENITGFSRYVLPHPEVTRFLADGDELELGGHRYEVIAVPGHAEGMLNFYNRKHGLLIAADHVLPKITPNISYWFMGEPNPLARYLQSLNKIQAYPIQLVLPSHGSPFTNVQQRIDEIISHHQKRLDLALAATRQPATVYEVNEQLFSQGLTEHELRFAIGETIAHLEYLVYKQQVRKFMKDGQWFYERVSD